MVPNRSPAAPRPSPAEVRARSVPRFAPGFDATVLGLILLVGLLVRGAYLREVRAKPEFTRPGVDALFHDYWARALASGDWTPPSGCADPQVRTSACLRPPAYPYLLAGIYAVSGGSRVAAVAANMAMGLASAALAFRIGRRWFGSAVGLIWAAWMSVYWGFVYFEGELHAETLLILLLLIDFYLLGRWSERPSAGRAAAAGVVLGLAVLTRPNVLLLAPAAAVWGVWLLVRRREPRRLLACGCAFGAGLAAAIAPATIRNYRASGDLVLVTSAGGINLFIGNHPGATGIMASNDPEIAAFRTCFDYPAVRRRVEAALGRPVSDAQVSRYYARRAWQFVAERPAEALALALRKAALFWGPAEVSHNKVDHYERAFSSVLSACPGGFAQVNALFIVGALLCAAEAVRARRAPVAPDDWTRRRAALAALAGAWIAAYFVSLLPFFIAGRYRVPVVPLLLLFVACAVEGFGRALRARAWGRSGAILAGSGAAFALASTPFVPYRPDLAQWYYDRGTACFERAASAAGEADARALLTRAAAEFERAVAVDDRHELAHNNLGIVLSRLGRTDAALEHYAAAIRARPDFALAHFNLGTLLGRLGRSQEAAGKFRDAVRLEPDYLEAWWNLAAEMVKQGRDDEAVSAFEQVLRIDPTNAAARRHVAALRRGGGPSEPRP